MTHPDREIVDLILNSTYCFWGGLPPCPKCGTDHGDPKADPLEDREWRALLKRLKDNDRQFAPGDRVWVTDPAQVRVLLARGLRLPLRATVGEVGAVVRNMNPPKITAVAEVVVDQIPDETLSVEVWGLLREKRPADDQA